MILKEEILNNEKQKTALTLYEKFIETLTEKQIVMFEEVLDNLFELNDELTQKDFKKALSSVLMLRWITYNNQILR